MAVYAYLAIDDRNSSRRGTVTADSPRQAREQLRRQGLQVRRMDEQTAGPTKRAFSWRQRRARPAAVVSAIGELATLLKAGIPVTEALETLTKQHKGLLATTLQMTLDRVTAGSTLAQAVAEHPAVFDELTVHLIEVGENAGNLETVLDQLADYQGRAMELKDRALTALLYPFIVLGVSVGVTIFLMTVVVPMLLTNLEEAGKTLPWPTRVLKGASDLLLGYWLPLAIGFVIIGILIAAGLRTPTGRRWWCLVILRLPLIGPMVCKQTLSRVAMVISTLMKSGMPYLESLHIAAGATRNEVIRQALQESGRLVGEGQDIGESLEASGLFPPLVVHIFRIGQQAGHLEPMLDRLAEDYDRQVATSSARLATALEPVLIISLAVVVGFILLATLLPILEAGNVL